MSDKPTNCDAFGWKLSSVLKHKAEFEKLLNRKLDDDYFMNNIKILYIVAQNKLQIQPEQDACISLLNDTYTVSEKPSLLSHVAFIPIKIDYFMFNPKLNNHFKPILHHQCDHNESKFKTPYPFVLDIIEFIETDVKYTTKLSFFAESLDAKSIFCSSGCCMECAALITPFIIRRMYLLSSLQRKSQAAIADDSEFKLVSFNIDKLCMLCLWLANILQHRYIRVKLNKNMDLMPTIFLTLFRLMMTSHDLYKDNIKLYKNRRNMITFTIWSLIKQIIINHHYIKKYYNRKDIDKDRYCDGYKVHITEWFMNELNILSEFLESDDPNESILNPFESDYFAGILILISLIKSNNIIGIIRGITHTIAMLDSPAMDIWLATHHLIHNIKEVGMFFKQSIQCSNRLKNKYRIKCQWKYCKKWKEVKKIYKCSNCQAINYCSKRCQKKDWSRGCHRFVCCSY